MHVEIIAIEQMYVLFDRKTVTTLIVKLPSGTNVRVPVSDEEVVAILEANADTKVMTEQPRVPRPAQPDRVAFEPSASDIPEAQQQMVDWMSVEDSVLPPIVKAEMQRRQLPVELPLQTVVDIAREIMGEIGAVKQQDQIGVVEHNVQLPRRRAAEPRRVETDEAGNPMVAQTAQSEQDPGEIYNDETGAQSI